MGKSSPKSPDYVGAARQDGISQRNLAEYNTAANRPDVVTPWGRQTWTRSQNVDQAAYQSALDKWTSDQRTRGGSDGVWSKGPRRPVESEFATGDWEMNLELNPDQQAALDSQMAIDKGKSQAAQGLLGQATSQFDKQIDYSGMPQRSGTISAGQSRNPFAFGSSDAQRQKAQDAVYKFQKPMLDQNREATEAQLANQGLARGSKAWENEMRRVDDTEARAQLQAIDSGRAEADQMFKQDLSRGQFDESQLTGDIMRSVQAGGFNNQNRQSAIGEEQSRRSQSLNELNALLNGTQVQQPNMPGFSGAAQAGGSSLSDSLTKQYQADANRASQENAQTGQAASMASMAAMMYFFSDARLKEHIEYTGDFIAGVPVADFKYRGVPGTIRGVIAQDVLRVHPHAVVVDISGFYKVNYSELLK
jgi:hypothetical protein